MPNRSTSDNAGKDKQVGMVEVTSPQSPCLTGGGGTCDCNFNPHASRELGLGQELTDHQQPETAPPPPEHRQFQREAARSPDS